MGFLHTQYSLANSLIRNYLFVVKSFEEEEKNLFSFRR